MPGDAGSSDGVVLETARLVLRPWRITDAPIQRELWSERDERVPARRRIDANGHPTVEEIEEWIRTAPAPERLGFLAIERVAEGDLIGYCGLTDGGPGEEREPELAYELLRRAQGQGYATEAATAVIDWARSSGFERLWATVWEWNTASRRVLAKLGFAETDRREVHPVHGTNLFTTVSL